jgi:hypothetical protein
MFYLVEYCHFSPTEAWSLPIEIRKWWLERKEKEVKKRNRTKNQPQAAETPMSKTPWAAPPAEKSKR